MGSVLLAPEVFKNISQSIFILELLFFTRGDILTFESFYQSGRPRSRHTAGGVLRLAQLLDQVQSRRDTRVCGSRTFIYGYGNLFPSSPFSQLAISI